jgi:hypothetical protein
VATLDQVAQHIRFGLETLSERNGHHEFEDLCRHFSRHRICFNILPATGPVAGGGDQGRDFETFRTFIHEAPNRFCARAENKKLAFACSLQKQVLPKVRSDVATIMQGSVQPDIVYFFSSQPVKVSERHALQTWAKDKHCVELEVFDREALAEQLADPELFWIAARYLDVPFEIFPKPIQANSEYERLRGKWFAEQANSERFADFIEIKRAARHALKEAPQDLLCWIDVLVNCEDKFRDSSIVIQVSYEVIVLTIRQTRSLRGQEERIRRFFAKIGLPQYPDIAENAELVHSYASTAFDVGEVELTRQELDSWHETILRAIETGVSAPCSANLRCNWLRLHGRVNLHAQIRLAEQPNLSDALLPWKALTKEVSGAAVFPVQDFHDEILETEQLLGDHPILEEILKELRPVMAKRTGAAAVADSHFRRAEQFLKREKIRRAMRELHEARINWFSEETLGGATLCCLLLAHCYRALELNYAAIYYSQAATFILVNHGGDSLKPRISEALLDAAQSAYAQGHWCYFFELADWAVAAHFHLAPKASRFDADPLRSLLGNMIYGLLSVRRVVPGLFDTLMSKARSWGMEKLVLDGITHLANTFNSWTEEQFEAALHKSLTGPPLADAGSHCEVMWSAHGIRWRMRWENRFELFRVAAEIVAFFQIALAELAECDLDIVPGTVVAQIELTEDDCVSAEELPDNDLNAWHFRVPSTPLAGQMGVDSFRLQMSECFVRIIRSVSVMRSELFLETITREAAPRLFRNDFFARRFPELIDIFAGPQRFAFLGRTTFACPFDFDKWYPKCASELRWRNSLHPQFDENAELARVKRRYDVGVAGLRYTIARLKCQPEVCATIRELKNKGWKDWHVLSALLNGVANYRVRQQYGEIIPSEVFKKAIQKEILAPETEDRLPVPAEVFETEALEMNLMMVILSSLSLAGLEPHQRFPKRFDLMEYVRYRWRYFDLDVPHTDLFDAQ